MPSPSSPTTPTPIHGSPLSSRRVLVLSPFPPRTDATNGGSRTIAHRIISISERHRVALAYLRGADDALDRRVEEACDATAEISLPPSYRSSWEALREATRGVPIWVQSLSAWSAAEAIKAFAKEWKPAVVQIEFESIGQYRSAVAEHPSVLVVHEPAIRTAENWARGRSGRSRVLSLVDRRAWAQFERRLLAAVERVVVFTDADARVLTLKRDVDVIPLTVPLPEVALDAVGSDPLTVLFFGNFGHAPNVDAAMRLVNDIFPAVLRRHPEARLLIAGEGPPTELRAHESDRVAVLGPVADLHPLLERAAVVAAPITLGGGMRVKVVEALAAGKALVTTPVAAAGLELNGDELVLASTPAEAAGAISRLLADPSARRLLGERARRWAERSLDPSREVDAYSRIYDDLVSPAGVTAAGTGLQ